MYYYTIIPKNKKPNRLSISVLHYRGMFERENAHIFDETIHEAQWQINRKQLVRFYVTRSWILNAVSIVARNDFWLDYFEAGASEWEASVTAWKLLITIDAIRYIRTRIRRAYRTEAEGSSRGEYFSRINRIPRLSGR